MRLNISNIKPLLVFLFLISCQSSVEIDIFSDEEAEVGLYIESSANGSGSLLKNKLLEVGDEFDFFAIQRDLKTNISENIRVTWQSGGDIGTLTISPSGKSATFKAIKPGSGYIIASADGIISQLDVKISSLVPSADPTLSLSSVLTSSTTESNERNIDIAITNDTDAQKWCLSETQITRPASGLITCNGGIGISDGWLLSQPTTFQLSEGDGTKEVFLWIANASEGVNASAVSYSINLDTTAISTHSIDLKDAISASDTTSYGATVALTTAGDSDAVSWCVVEVIQGAAVPTTPAWNDACFQAKPTSQLLGAVGSRTVYLFVVDIAGNVSNGATDTINYTLNTAPTGVDDSGVTGSANSINLNLTSNDTDPEGEGLTVTAVTSPSFGTAVIESNGTVTFNPSGNTGTATFTYTVSDPRGLTDTATVTMTSLSPYTWIGQTDDKWSTATNWCGSYTGGSCQFDLASAPGSSHVAEFNSMCTTYCDAEIDSNTSVLGLKLDTGFTGSLTQASGTTLTIGLSRFYLRDGVFNGGDSLINFNGSGLVQTGGTFNSTSGVLKFYYYNSSFLSTDLTNNFGFIQTVGTFNHNNGTVRFESEVRMSDDRRYATTQKININSSINFYNMIIDLDDKTSDGTYNQSKIAITAGDIINVENDLTIIDGEIDGGTINLEGNLIATCASARYCAGNDYQTSSANAINRVPTKGSKRRGGGTVIIKFTGSSPQTYSVAANTLLPRFVIPVGAAVSPFAGTTDLHVASFLQQGGSFQAPSGEFRVGHLSALGISSSSQGFQVLPGSTYDHNNGTLFLVQVRNESSLKTAMVLEIASGITLNNLRVALLDKYSLGGYDDARLVLSSTPIVVLGDFRHEDGIISSGVFQIHGDLTTVNLSSQRRPEGGNTQYEMVGSSLQSIDIGGSNFTTTSITLDNAAGAILTNTSGLSGQTDFDLVNGDLDLNGFNFTGIENLSITNTSSVTKNGGQLDYVTCSGPATCPVDDM